MFRARPVRGQSLNSPSQQKPKVSATPSLRGFAGEPVPASFPAQIRESGGPLRSICAAPSCGRVGAVDYATAPLSEPDLRASHPALWLSVSI